MITQSFDVYRVGVNREYITLMLVYCLIFLLYDCDESSPSRPQLGW